MPSDLPETIGALKSSPVVRRHPANPVLAAKDVPYPATLVYNAGVCKFQGKYVMVFRNDVYPPDKHIPGHLIEINLGLATSDDGIKWQVAPKPCFRWIDEEVERAYDPRLTVVNGRVYMCFALDTRHGLRGGIAVTDDFERFEILSLSAPDNRNMVLFPEKIGGRYVMMHRAIDRSGVALVTLS